MIGLDLRREKVSGCLVHLGGALEAELSCPIAANASRRAILDLMHGVVDQLRSAATVPVMGIGIGPIGHVDPTTGVIRPQAFDSMHGVNLVEVLAALYGLPVSVRTGASAAAVGIFRPKTT